MPTLSRSYVLVRVLAHLWRRKPSSSKVGTCKKLDILFMDNLGCLSSGRERTSPVIEKHLTEERLISRNTCTGYPRVPKEHPRGAVL